MYGSFLGELSSPHTGKSVHGSVEFDCLWLLSFVGCFYVLGFSGLGVGQHSVQVGGMTVEGALHF